MKTRQELVLDFMLALSANPEITGKSSTDRDKARDIFLLASELSEKYIKIVSGVYA